MIIIQIQIRFHVAVGHVDAHFDGAAWGQVVVLVLELADCSTLQMLSLRLIPSPPPSCLPSSLSSPSHSSFWLRPKPSTFPCVPWLKSFSARGKT